MAVALCLTSAAVLAQDNNLALIHPDSVFTLTEQDIIDEHIEANRTLAGQWQYDKPSIQAQGTSLIGKLGKPLAKNKLKKKLDKAYKKLKIKQRWSSMTLSEDGHWTMTVVGRKLGGNYFFNPTSGCITLNWHGLTINATAKRENKHLHLLFDTDRLLSIMRLISGLSNNDTLKALAFLSDNYQDVNVGFDLKLAANR